MQTTPGGGWGLLAVIVVIVCLAALALWRRGSPTRSHAHEELGLLEDDERSAEEMRAAADRAAKAGNWNLALQERFRAVVRGLEERTIIDRRPGWTAQEASSVAGQQLEPLAVELMAGARLFDAVTYGRRQADAESEGQVRALDKAARSASPRRKAPAAATLVVPR